MPTINTRFTTFADGADGHNFAWDNPSNAQDHDTNYVTPQLPALVGPGQKLSNYLLCTGLEPPIPSGPVLAVRLLLYRFQGPNVGEDPISDEFIYPILAGVKQTAVNYASALTWGNANEGKLYTLPAYTAAQLNDPNFGVAIEVDVGDNTTFNNQPRIDQAMLIVQTVHSGGGGSEGRLSERMRRIGGMGVR